MKKLLLLWVLAIVCLGFVFANGGAEDDGAMMDKEDDAMMMEDDKDGAMMDKEDDAMMMEDDKDGAMMDKDDDSMMMEEDKDGAMMDKDDDAMMMSGAMVMEYKSLESSAMYADDGPTVLFFWASWNAESKAILEDLENHTTTIDEDITIVVIDYDEADDLKGQYGITAPTSFVQIDSEGNTVAIWNGGDVATIGNRVRR